MGVLPPRSVWKILSVEAPIYLIYDIYDDGWVLVSVSEEQWKPSRIVNLGKLFGRHHVLVRAGLCRNKHLCQRGNAGLGCQISECKRSKLFQHIIIRGSKCQQERFESGRSESGKRTGSISSNVVVFRSAMLHIWRVGGRREFKVFINLQVMQAVYHCDSLSVPHPFD